MKRFRKFFETEKEAVGFQKRNGGEIYANVADSETRMKYLVEYTICNNLTDLKNAYPYVVVWTEL